MKTGIVIVLAAVAGLLALFAFLRIIFSATLKKLRLMVLARFNPEDIILLNLGANFFGEESKGGRQVRGNGALVLVRDAVVFFRAAPAREYRIPLADILEKSLPRSLNGRSVFTPLLRIDYTVAGRPEAAAWAVRGPEQWKLRIEQLRAPAPES
jgi:hypothetical protein